MKLFVAWKKLYTKQRIKNNISLQVDEVVLVQYNLVD